ncbi:hypothetical protein MICAK_1070007 [Microcystis aeruginosa PCC 9701]|uniref:Uncharacterized protein n=1 Tax=Microcystis aeruginosa PCC 9701 TaxID=721123 RepID=I4IKJ0_MICAE|nr:hypothetical protein MICAK_1070007 [Microcystis aeruginosa PCC 9701]
MIKLSEGFARMGMLTTYLRMSKWMWWQSSQLYRIEPLVKIKNCC